MKCLFASIHRLSESENNLRWMAYTQRFGSGLLLLMVVILSVWSWKALFPIKEARFFSIVAVVFIMLQGLLGSTALLWSETNTVIALHIGFTLISFASVMSLTFIAFECENQDNSLTNAFTFSFRKLLYFMLCCIFIFAVTGAFVLHFILSAGCIDWPNCNPPLKVPLDYKIVATILVFASIMFLWIAHHYKTNKNIYYSILISLLFVSVQIINGTVVVFSGFSIGITIFHAFSSSLVFGILCYVSFLGNS